MYPILNPMDLGFFCAHSYTFGSKRNEELKYMPIEHADKTKG